MTEQGSAFRGRSLPAGHKRCNEWLIVCSILHRSFVEQGSPFTHRPTYRSPCNFSSFVILHVLVIASFDFRTIICEVVVSVLWRLAVDLEGAAQPIFALLKSISGCCFINFSSISCFFCSSLVGFPCLFISWSYIIFSTMPLVSPSRSPSLLFSGTILDVSILGAEVMMCGHQCEFGDLARLTTISLVLSASVESVQVESSTTMG